MTTFFKNGAPDGYTKTHWSHLLHYKVTQFTLVIATPLINDLTFLRLPYWKIDALGGPDILILALASENYISPRQPSPLCPWQDEWERLPVVPLAHSI